MPRGLPPGVGGCIDTRYPELALATDFDGINDRMELAFGSPAWPTTGYTMLGWFRADTVASQRMLAATKSTANGDGLYLYLNNGALRFTASGGLDLPFANPLAARRYHVALSLDASRGYACYLDAELRLSGALTPAQMPTLVAGHFFGSLFDGLLADWACFARALSAGEVLSVVQRRDLRHLSPEGLQGRYPLASLIATGPDQGRAPDTSGLGRHLTLFNMPANPIVPFPSL